MIKSPEIKINPNVLKTLRESSGYTVEEIAKKNKTTVTKVQEAEKGFASNPGKRDGYIMWLEEGRLR